MPKVVLYNNLKLIGEGIESLLKKIPSLEVLGKYEKLSPLVSLLRSGLEVDLIILSMDSIYDEELEWIKIINNSIKSPILLLCDHPNLSAIKKAFKYGVKGCISMSDDLSDVELAVRRLNDGQTYLSSNMAFRTIDYWPSESIQMLEVSFSSREQEILTLIAKGFTNQEIANKIFTSKRTVEGHRQNLLTKTGSINTAQLIVKAMKMGWLE